MKDYFALLDSLIGVPLIGNESMSEILGESCSDVILGDVISIEVDAGQMSFSVFISCHYEIVIIRILLISFLVAQFSEVIGIISHGMLDSIIKQECLMT